MSLTLDSEPFFLSRAKAIGLKDDDLDKLKVAGVASLADLTFFTTYQPGTPDDSNLVASVKRALNTDDVVPATLIQIRRLHFEAHALFLADLKQRVTATD